MRHYIYNRGGRYVNAEVATPSGLPGDAEACGHEQNPMILSREQLLAVDAEALQRGGLTTTAFEAIYDAEVALLEPVRPGPTGSTSRKGWSASRSCPASVAFGCPRCDRTTCRPSSTPC